MNIPDLFYCRRCKAPVVLSQAAWYHCTGCTVVYHYEYSEDKKEWFWKAIET